MPRRLSAEQLEYIAMQVYVQDAATAAAEAAGVALKPVPLVWDGGSMEIRRGPHRVVLETAARRLELTIEHGHPDDATWRASVESAFARGLAAAP